MNKKILSLACLAMPLLASASDIDYHPLTLTGFNADVVVTAGEKLKATMGANDRCFFSEDRQLRGGLPQSLHGMFSDVPYDLANFSDNCSLLLSAGKDGGEATAYPSTGTLRLTTPVVAGHTLWVLATAPQGTSQMTVMLHYTDGSSSKSAACTVGNWLKSTYQGTAFWQLGIIGASGITSQYHYALYEVPITIPEADRAKTISSVDFNLISGTQLAVFALTSTEKDAPSSTPERKLFFISDSHLDTQWNWTVKNTIQEYVKNTLTQNFARFDDPGDHNFNFNFEGAIKYMWAKEYYPAEYQRLKNYIKQGRWNIAGNAIDANDVNIGSAESIIRNFLYGQSFYEREFGVRGGRDVMLPDCFGFPWSLPSLAAHCGMKYFHTNKLAWNTAYAYNSLPRLARWRGVDGSELLAVIKTNAYDDHEKWRKDMSRDAEMFNEAGSNLTNYGIPAAIKYVGPRSDRGGGLDKQTADSLSKSVDATGPLSVAVGSSTGMLDQVFHMGYDKLPIINHGLPMRAHGVGGYTSRTMLKFWMRKGEMLGDAAEKASVAASWLGALPYQQSTLTNAWVRLLWHQFHDDIPGTCIEEAYRYTVNDQVLNQLDFSRTLNNAVGGVARSLNTNQYAGTPVVVYNPLSIDRTDLVEATIPMNDNVTALSVTGPDGKSAPYQILNHKNGQMKILLLATVPSLGYASYHVAPSTEPQAANAGLSITDNGMENSRYRVTINNNGDVSSIIDKAQDNKEMLSAPIRLAMLYDESTSWPSWEIHGDQLQKEPREYVDNEGLETEIVERGPLRVSMRIKRTKAGSTFYQYIRLAAAGASDRIDFVNEVDWRTRERMLKATFPLTASNSKATYDLSLGVEENNNSTNYSTDIYNTDAHCEFLGHEWADVTNRDNTFGVSILNDCKYGWDKQKDNTIRLTLIHTPKVSTNYSYQGIQDLGLNKFTYSFYAHTGKWSSATQWEADRLNEPMLAYVTTPHEGSLGTSFSFAEVDNPHVAVKALKKAEGSDKMIMRFYELTGAEQDVKVTLPADIASAEEVNGVEDLVGPATYSGRTLSFHIGSFQPKTFALTLASPTVAQSAAQAPVSTPATLDYTTDVMSSNARRADTDIPVAFPAELVPDTVIADGVAFRMGSRADGAKNAVRCAGQTISLPTTSRGQRVYLLASSLNTDGSQATFNLGGRDTLLHIGYYGGNVGVFSNDLDTRKTYRLENTALTATHTHIASNSTDGVYEYLYMFKYALPLPNGALSLTLPTDDNILVYAVTVADNANDDTHPASQVVQVLENTDTKDPFDAVLHTDSVLMPSKVSASGQTNVSEGPHQAADGNLTTKWCDNTSPAKWITYEFDEPVVVSAWRVTNGGSEGSGNIAREYCLQRFTNEGWVDVDRVNDNFFNTTDNTLEAPIVTKAVRLRYVYATQDTKNVGTARLYDFRVYGHEASEEEQDTTSMIISRMPTSGTGRQVARVISSSGRTQVSEDPYYIFDSDRKTKWCDNSSSSPYVIIKLAGRYQLNRLDIYDARTYEDVDNSSWYRISVSDDGKQFRRVAYKSNVANESRHTCTLSEPVEAQYVRLDMARGGGGAARVYQFDIWGIYKGEGTESDSEPVSLQKTVIGSAYLTDQQHSALALFDGRLTEPEWSWTALRTDAPTVCWVVVDLENEYNISKVVLYDALSLGDGATGSNLNVYRVFASSVRPTASEMEAYGKSLAGRSHWTRLAQRSGEGKVNVKTIEPSTPVRGRYVMLDFSKWQVTTMSQLAELQVFGKRVTTGINDISSDNADDAISVWPTLLHRGEPIRVSAPAHAKWSLYAIGGQLVANGGIGNEASGDISTSTLSPGIYLVRVSNGNLSKTTKLIVK